MRRSTRNNRRPLKRYFLSPQPRIAMPFGAAMPCDYLSNLNTTPIADLRPYRGMKTLNLIAVASMSDKIYSDLVNRVLVIDCGEELQISRACHRSNLSADEITATIASWPCATNTTGSGHCRVCCIGKLANRGLTEIKRNSRHEYGNMGDTFWSLLSEINAVTFATSHTP